MVPTISVDKTDGCQVFLSKDSLQCEFITAKSSEMNISVPKGDEGDFVSTLCSELCVCVCMCVYVCVCVCVCVRAWVVCVCVKF